MTTINNDDQRERFKDDMAQCPPQISSATRQALENEGFDDAAAFKRFINNWLNDRTSCPFTVEVEKLNKCSDLRDRIDTPTGTGGIRGSVEDYYNGLDPSSTDAENLERLLNNWPDDHPEGEDLEIDC